MNTIDFLSINEKDMNLEPTFSECLFDLIKQKNVKASEVYKKVNFSRQMMSKIRSTKNYKASKSTVFAFSLALELNIEDTEKLLKAAGYCFSNSFKTDWLIRLLIQHKCYNICFVNEVLEHFGCELLGGC